jgi:hypothetical protein
MGWQMSLHNYTNEELQAELTRRVEEEKAQALTPQAEMDWSPLVKLISHDLDQSKDSFLVERTIYIMGQQPNIAGATVWF